MDFRKFVTRLLDERGVFKIVARDCGVTVTYTVLSLNDAVRNARYRRDHGYTVTVSRQLKDGAWEVIDQG